MPPRPFDAPALLREVGLLPDGPAVWARGRPVPAGGPGIVVVEMATPLARAPIELTRVGKWIERVPTLTVDGARPTSRALAARLGAFWLPSQPVVYVGSSTSSIGGRVAAMQATALGDRRPHPAGHWLHALDASTAMRVWWARTDATEEYEDALLTAFASGVPPEEIAALPDRDVVLPWAVLRRPTGERRSTGIAGSLLAEPREAPTPPTRIVQVPDGDAEGARGEPPARRARSSRGSTGGRSRAAANVVSLTAEGAERLRAELRELVDVRRPEVIGRIRTAKELGDLRENADYTAAREEQSFLEGRIQALEARLRDAVITEAPAASDGADIGSTMTVEIDGEEVVYTLVGSVESDPAAGRLSVASPVGRALVGSRTGETVDVETPRGTVRYRVLAIE